jgi:hypothetical protein
MPAPRKIPPTAEILKKLEQGWTHQQIAEWASQEAGERVARATISVAIHRAGKTKPIRYSRELPWRVKDKHARKYHALMLRLQARFDRGQRLSEEDQRKLASWRRALERDDAVVHYEPDTEPGWWKVRRRPGVDLWWIREPTA